MCCPPIADKVITVRYRAANLNAYNLQQFAGNICLIKAMGTPFPLSTFTLPPVSVFEHFPISSTQSIHTSIWML